jgi:hypothetical protein
MDVSDLLAITFKEKVKIKVAKLGTPKKISFLKQTFLSDNFLQSYHFNRMPTIIAITLSVAFCQTLLIRTDWIAKTDIAQTMENMTNLCVGCQCYFIFSTKEKQRHEMKCLRSITCSIV